MAQNLHRERHIDPMTEAARGPSDVFWRPDPETVQRTRMMALARKLGVSGYPELVRYGVDNLDQFWAAAVDDIEIEWYRRYHAVRDSLATPQALPIDSPCSLTSTSATCRFANGSTVFWTERL